MSQTKSISITVVIPTCNVGGYIAECLDSALSQTEPIEEIICVDDRSEDNTCEIIEQYVNKHQCIRLIKLEEKGTANIARKVGALAATGDYIWFVDGDDLIKPGAASEIRQILKENSVDILHFNTEVQSCANHEPQRIKNCEKFLKPYAGKLFSSDVFLGCFETSKYQYTLWNKVFSKELCLKAFQDVETIPLPIAQDKYAYFVLAYHARSYYGVSDKFLYVYRFGLGNTGLTIVDKNRFERYCKMGLVADAMKRFAKGKNIQAHIVDKAIKQLLVSSLGGWDLLRESDKAWGFSKLLEYWSPVEVISQLSIKNFYQRKKIASQLVGFDENRSLTKPVKRIGVYYHRISIGGAQRVVVKLIETWRSLGYECVLFTDENPSENDYSLPAGVDRVVIPSCFTTKGSNYHLRAEAISDLVQRYDLDTIVYHAWVAPCLLWDTLLFKALSVRVLVHTHCVFSFLLTNLNKVWLELPYIYSLVDGVVALSKTDQEFWSQFSKRVYEVVNPLTFNVCDTPVSALDGKNIVWVGRLSGEKRPGDALYIMNRVLKAHPDARLFMVGDNEKQPRVLAGLKSLAEKLGISSNVEFCGFTNDVGAYYSKSSLFLMTSQFEGFPLALAEAKSMGLPTVMYDLPFLTLSEGHLGILSVPMGQIAAAANEVCRVFADRQLLTSLAFDARNHMEKLGAKDNALMWENIFRDLEVTRDAKSKMPLLWDTLIGHFEIGLDRVKKDPHKEFRTKELLNMLKHKLKTKIKKFFRK